MKVEIRKVYAMDVEPGMMFQNRHGSWVKCTIVTRAFPKVYLESRLTLSEYPATDKVKVRVTITEAKGK